MDSSAWYPGLGERKAGTRPVLQREEELHLEGQESLWFWLGANLQVLFSLETHSGKEVMFVNLTV